jgi:hypothetical protein
MLCFFFCYMDHEKEIGENVRCEQDQTIIRLKSWYSTDMMRRNAKNVHMYIVPLWFRPVVGGEGVVGSFFDSEV